MSRFWIFQSCGSLRIGLLSSFPQGCSLGDGAFQEKSAKKMREIIDGGAATILVSHSLAQIRELCNKVLWLHKGTQVEFGESGPICDRYEAFLAG